MTDDAKPKRKHLTLDDRAILANIEQFADDLQAAIDEEAKKSARQAQGMARANAPWKNQSGFARENLRGTSYTTYRYTHIVLVTGMEYGVFLELRNAGKYAIVAKTMKEIREDFLARIKGLMQ